MGTSNNKSKNAGIETLQKEMERTLPLSKAIGVRIIKLGAKEARVAAPLKGNTNPKGTAFGGSLYNLAIFSCWAWLSSWLESQDLKFEVVIQRGTMEYLAPVSGDFEASCRGPVAEELSRFWEGLKRKSRARLTLVSEIQGQKGVAFRLEGQFVVYIKE